VSTPSIFKDKETQAKKSKYFAPITQLIRDRVKKSKSPNLKLRALSRTEGWGCQAAAGPEQKDLGRHRGKRSTAGDGAEGLLFFGFFAFEKIDFPFSLLKFFFLFLL